MTFKVKLGVSLLVGRKRDTINRELIVELAKIEDAEGIYKALKANLIEISDFNSIPKEEIKLLEENGFLRKEVDIDYYRKLINEDNCDIYVAKSKSGNVIGFASIHKNEYNVRDFRSTLNNLYIDDKDIISLLTHKDKKFAYLDQISIIPDFKRKGVGYAIISKALYDIKSPFVAFIVEKPLANKASIFWHEYCGFELVGTADGGYKGQKFEWKIYINWNNEN